MKWSREGIMVPTCIFEAGTIDGSVQVTCKCGHASRFDAKPLWWHFQRRGWDDNFGRARMRFWCRVCRSRIGKKVRPASIESVRWIKGDFELPWPDQQTWKRATARVR